MGLRQKVRNSMIALSLVYTAVRVFFVHATLVSYGVNLWVFFVIDAVAGVLYVLGLEQLVVALSPKTKQHWLRVCAWALCAICMFSLPYLYIFISSNQLPSGMVWGLGVVVALLAANAFLTIKRRVRRKE